MATATTPAGEANANTKHAILRASTRAKISKSKPATTRTTSRSSSSSTPTTTPTETKIQHQPSPHLDTALVTRSLRRIAAHPTLTSFRRLVYRTLLSVPPGRWTTYAALSTFLRSHSGSGSCARAIGAAMRSNPFSPDVPCHRVLATDRTIGGYKGAWGTGGAYAVEKTKLLAQEGVVFDERGRAAGECFTEFVDLGEVYEV